MATDGRRSTREMRGALALLHDEHAVLTWQWQVLSDAAASGQPAGTLRRYLQGFVNSARSHFQTEERLMAFARSPGSEAHRADHEHLLDTAGVRLRQTDAALREKDWPQLVAEIRDWLQRHAERHDRPLEMLVDRRGDRSAAAG